LLINAGGESVKNRALLLTVLADPLERGNDEEPELTRGGCVPSETVARGKPISFGAATR